MKIRQGFVSNSSSSSFILKTFMNKKQFIEVLSNERFLDFNTTSSIKEELLSKIACEIYKIKERMKEAKIEYSKSKKNKTLPWYKLEVKSLKDSLEGFETLKEKASKQEIFKTLIEYIGRVYQCEVSLDKSNKTIVVEGYTTMYNDFSDIPEFIKNFITCAMISNKDSNSLFFGKLDENKMVLEAIKDY